MLTAQHNSQRHWNRDQLSSGRDKSSHITHIRASVSSAALIAMNFAARETVYSLINRNDRIIASLPTTAKPTTNMVSPTHASWVLAMATWDYVCFTRRFFVFVSFRFVCLEKKPVPSAGGAARRIEKTVAILNSIRR